MYITFSLKSPCALSKSIIIYVFVCMHIYTHIDKIAMNANIYQAATM